MDQNPFVSPEIQPVAPKVSDDDPGPWTDGKVMIARRLSELPDRCIYCNTSANGRRRFVMDQYFGDAESSFVILSALTIAGLPISAIYLLLRATVVGRKLGYGICSIHAARIRRQRVAGAIVFIVATVSATVVIFAGPMPWVLITRSMHPSDVVAIVLMALFVISIIGVIVCVLAHPVSGFQLPVFVRRVNHDFVWLAGPEPAFLNDLPEWPSQ